MSYCFFENLTSLQQEEYCKQLKDKFLLGDFLVERGMDRRPANRLQVALRESMFEILYMSNEEIEDAIWQSYMDLQQLDEDQFMQIVYFTRAVHRVFSTDKHDKMTGFWMDIGVVYHNAVLISSALSMHPENLPDKSEAEIRALLSANESFVRSGWIIDWVVASRNPIGYERVPLPEKALVERWYWNCHRMRDGRITMCEEGGWYCHEEKAYDAPPAGADAGVASRPTVNVYLV